MKEPNFFIIGAPKSGTTALSEYLRQHPAVFFSNPKEPHFFNEDFVNRFTKTWSEYLAYFEEADQRHRAVGEGSVFYLSSEVAVPRILAFQPSAKFVVMLRNPVDMAYSWHSQAIYSFGEDIRDFGTAWHLQAERKRGRKTPRFCSEVKVLLYGELCLVGRQLERLYSSVPPNQVKVIFFEDFVTDTRRVYEEVLEFLGLEPDGRTSFPRVNANKEFRSFEAARLLRYSQLAWMPLKKALGLSAKVGVGKRLRALNTVGKKRQPLNPEFQRELKEYFKEDIGLLSRLTGRDLRHWVA